MVPPLKELVDPAIVGRLKVAGPRKDALPAFAESDRSVTGLLRDQDLVAIAAIRPAI